jgi:hypothetical protein
MRSSGSGADGNGMLPSAGFSLNCAIAGGSHVALKTTKAKAARFIVLFMLRLLKDWFRVRMAE